MSEELDLHLGAADMIRRYVAPFVIALAGSNGGDIAESDLVVPEYGGARLKFVIRTARSKAQKDQVTIRYRRPSGADTLLQRILSGSVDLLFYGQLSARGTDIQWGRLLRADKIKEWYEAGHVGQIGPVNGDGTRFRIFQIQPDWIVWTFDVPLNLP